MQEGRILASRTPSPSASTAIPIILTVPQTTRSSPLRVIYYYYIGAAGFCYYLLKIT